MPYRKSHIPDFGALAKKIRSVATAVVVAGVDEYAEFQRQQFVDRIEAQGFASFRMVLYPESGTNLSPRWLDRKAAAGADDRTMIATRHYVDHIRVHRKLAKDKRSGEWRIGFRPGLRARDLDGKIVAATLDEVANYQEHGTRHIPARPHWGPQFRRIQRETPKVRRVIRARVFTAVCAAVGKKMARGK